MPLKKFTKFLGAMANDNRFAILLALQERPLNVSELCERLDLEQSCVSHSLKRLVAERLVIAENQGSYRIYSIHSEPVSVFLRELVRFCEVLADEEATVLSELREREVELSSILDHAPITLSVIDREGTYLAIAGDIVRRFGQTGETYVGKNMHDFHPVGTPVRDNIERALAGEEVRWSLEVGGFAFENFSLPIRNAAGEVERVLSVTINATEWLHKKRPGATLDDMFFLNEYTSGNRLFVDRDRKILSANRSETGEDRGAWTGQELFQAMPELRSIAFEKALADAFLLGTRQEILSDITEGGQARRYRIRLAPIWQHSLVFAIAIFFTLA